MSSNENYSGCFLTISIVCVGFGILIAITKGFEAIGEEMKKDPWNVFGIVVVIGIICFGIYKAVENDKK